MVAQQSNPYKGYHIYTHSSGGTQPPYTATFGFAEARAGGDVGPIETVQCNGKYQTEPEAHAAANVAARQHIDALVARK